MTSPLFGLALCLLITSHFSAAAAQGAFVEPPESYSQRSLSEEETTLPCRYLVDPAKGEVVVQVNWYKVKADGTKEPITTAHTTDGQTASGSWSGRVRFKSSQPTVDSSMVITSTVLADEGTYICHVITFPGGIFERQQSLIVWTKPISSLDPVVLVEGQSYQVAASCRAVAHPPPRLSWDTELTGKATNRTLDGGSVSSYFSLYPLRNMNEKRLDCLVWHPALEHPRRISNMLVVHYPPVTRVEQDPPVTRVEHLDQNWCVGLEAAALRCVSEGNPKPQSFTWTRKDKALPEGVTSHPDGTLMFSRPINLTDAGVYQCVAKNEVGEGRGEANITVTDGPPIITWLEKNMLMVIVGSLGVGLLLFMLTIFLVVTSRHKRKAKSLKRELTVKKEEINTLSRQASFRRINSVSTEARGMMEENIPLRVEGTLRNSLSSLGQEQSRCRDSPSTLSGRGGGGRGGGGNGGGGGGEGGGDLDYLGRPVIYNNSRRGRERAMDRDEESRLRVESYVRNSTMSLQDTRLLPPLQPTPFPIIQSTELLRTLNGRAITPTEGGLKPVNHFGRNQQHSTLSATYPPVTDDEEEEDEGLGGPRSPGDQSGADDLESETNSSQVSGPVNHNFQQANGTIRGKPRVGSALLHPHASYIHKAQIV